MPCKNCGFIVNDTDEVCPSCGALLKDLEDSELKEEPEAKLPPEVNRHPKEVKIEGYPIFKMPTETKKKNHTILYVLIGIILILGLVLSIMNLKNSYTKYKESKAEDNNIRYSGYLFDIPDDYHIYNSLDGLTITNKNEDVAYTIQLISNTFILCLNDKEKLASEYEKQGFEVSNIQEKTVQDNDYLTMELKKDDNSLLVAYRSAPRSDSFVVMITFKDNKTDYQELENLENILNKVLIEDINK